MNQPRVMYYRAREDQTVNELPAFFGHVEFQGEKVRGKHYRARIDKDDRSYIIGYYWLEQDADEFLQKSEARAIIEISGEEFDTLLDKWTRGGQAPAFCWNPGESYKVEQVSGQGGG